MKQSPIRKLRRDRSRLEQEFQLARGTGDKEGADGRLGGVLLWRVTLTGTNRALGGSLTAG